MNFDSQLGFYKRNPENTEFMEFEAKKLSNCFQLASEIFKVYQSNFKSPVFSSIAYAIKVEKKLVPNSNNFLRQYNWNDFMETENNSLTFNFYFQQFF